MSRSARAWAKRLMLVLMTVVGLEVIARLANAFVGFADPVRWMLASVRPETQLDAEQPDPAPPGKLAIRTPAGRPVRAEPYVLGGRLITQADRDRAWRWITPSDSAAQPAAFIFGESAAFGYPYPYALSFAAQLDAEARPSGWCVWNAARPGINSVDLVPLVRQAIGEFSPRQVIILSGNNEFIRWEPGFWPFRSRLLSGLLMVGRHSRLMDAAWYLALSRRTWAPMQASGDTDPRAFSPHTELVGYTVAARFPYELYLPFDEAAWARARDAYLTRFERNLSGLVAASLERGIPVVLMTNPLRLRLSPAWKTPQPLVQQSQDLREARHLVDRLMADAEAGRWSAVWEQAGMASDRYPVAPLFPYLAAWAAERMGRFEPARRHYGEARMRMIGNLGAIPQFNEAIRRVAARTGVALVDIERLFEQHAARDGGDSIDPFMDDDCHPNPAGHRIIAEALMPLMKWNERTEPHPSLR